MAAKNSSGKKLTKEERKKRKQKKIAILVLEGIVVVVLIIALYFVSKLDMVHRTDLDEKDIVTNKDNEEDLLVDKGDLKFNDSLTGHMAGYRNIALFGLDARNNNLGKGSRSDTIIVASINEETKEVKLVSVYRDTFLNVGNDTYGKCNKAYAQGGPQQAINMLNMNLDLNITDYITVGWSAVADTVDELGGIEIDVDSEEIGHLNNYQVETSKSLGKSYTKLTQTGLINLDGVQAVSYCRIRYTKGDDYKRTERQREVISAIADKAKKASPDKLNAIANKIFPQTATSLQLSEILDLLKDVTSYNIGETGGFPIAEYRATKVMPGDGDSVIPNNLEVNVKVLHEFLFGEEDGYAPSKAVQGYSSIIAQKTGYNGPAASDSGASGDTGGGDDGESAE